MSQLSTPSPAAARDPRWSGGTVVRAGNGDGQLLVILSAPDVDGYSRAAPLAVSVPPQGVGLALEPGDFVTGAAAGWLRLDRMDGSVSRRPRWWAR